MLNNCYFYNWIGFGFYKCVTDVVGMPLVGVKFGLKMIQGGTVALNCKDFGGGTH